MPDTLRLMMSDKIEYVRAVWPRCKSWPGHAGWGVEPQARTSLIQSYQPNFPLNFPLAHPAVFPYSSCASASGSVSGTPAAGVVPQERCHDN